MASLQVVRVRSRRREIDFAPGAALEVPHIEAVRFRGAGPKRAGPGRARFFNAAHAIAQGREDGDYLVGGQFGVADVLVSNALSFAKRAKYREPLPPVLEDYLTRLFERPAQEHAPQSESAAPTSSLRGPNLANT
jgi:glutathione S-transferase